VHHCFQGVVAVNTYTKVNKEDPDEQAHEDATEDEKTSRTHDIGASCVGLLAYANALTM